MSSRRVLIATVLSTALASPAWPAQLPTSSPYALVLDLYRAGDHRAALSNLAMLTSAQIASAQETLFRAFDSSVPDEVRRATSAMRVAALVHTERAMGALGRVDVPGWKYEIGVARTYVEKLVARDPAARFSRMWWLLVTTYLQGQVALAGAKEFGELARASVGDSPELFLAIGATEEMGWTAHEADRDSPFKGDLEDAERAYRKALAAQPDLIEARLRLGRVLTLRGDTQAARNVLAEIGEGAETGYRYLARMFEGDAFERAGKDPEAENCYLAATAVAPESQSAYVALAHMRHKKGARFEAAETVRFTTRERTGPDTMEPWFWYTRGVSWRAKGYLEDLIAMVRQ